MKRRRLMRTYTPEFRHEAVRLAKQVGLTEAADRLEMPMKSLANWVRAARAGKLRSVGATKPSANRAGIDSEVEAENRRLRAEVAALRTERDILKKAAAYFARESQ